MRPIYKYAENARENIRTGADQQAAIKASVDPMLRNIETRSGMVEGANVLQSNLYEGMGMAGQDAYLTALRDKLPSYINNYRAYIEEQKDKNKGSGGDSNGIMPIQPQYGQYPSPGSYFPQPKMPEWMKSIPYLNAFMGAVPMGSDYSYYMIPPSQRLARRMASQPGRMAYE